MQNTFGHLALSHRPFFVPRGFWMSFKDYDGEPTNVREHQDAYEFFTRLQVSPVAVSSDPLPLDLRVTAWPESQLHQARQSAVYVINLARVTTGCRAVVVELSI